MERWPEISYAAFKPTLESLRQWLQIVGKYRLAREPWLNHSWHATFYVDARGLTSSIVHCRALSLEFHFDFVHHQLTMLASDGRQQSLPLEATSVAAFHGRFVGALQLLGVESDFHGVPNEVENPVPFAENHAQGDYEPELAAAYWRALLQVDRVFRRFRSGFLGKVSPVHLFWGSFDLAVTRFSGRRAPLHPGGIPALPDAITREAYSHEVSSCGFWPGGAGTDFPAFYSYAYPAPKGFADSRVAPEQAFFDTKLGEFLLPYDVVRRARDPDAVLLAFLQSTYDTAARLGDWNRAELECPLGTPRVPRPL